MREQLKKIGEQKYKLLFCICLAVLVFPAFKTYEHFFKFYITACFSELGPISRSMPVYYKGFRIGKTDRIMPSPDFKTSSVRLIFNSDMSLLPENVTAKVKNFDDEGQRKEHYIEIEYPVEPSKKFLRKGDVVRGMTEPDIASFMSAQVESGAFGAISDNAAKTMVSIEKTSDSVRELVKDVKLLLDQMRPDVLAAVKNANSAAKNLDNAAKNTSKITSEINEFSVKLNKSVNKAGMESAASNLGKTFENLEQSTQNLKEITENVDKATSGLGGTFAKLDSSMDELNSTMTSVKNITDGVNQTMGKRFGGARLIFGKPTGASTGAAGSSCGE
jgi:ABC-type transporter Mla subunit MlaD